MDNQSNQRTLLDNSKTAHATRAKRSTHRLGPDRIGRSAAVIHGGAEWRPTSDFIRERLEHIHQASDYLKSVIPHLPDAEGAGLLQRQLEQATYVLNNGMPAELPFLAQGPRSRLRVAAAVREWLLTSRHPRKEEHLKRFLKAYQELAPFYLTEIRLIPTAMRLAVAERCSMLPSPATSNHIELLPRLVDELARTAALIMEIDWEEFGEAVSTVHRLLEHDPSHDYRQMDFASRDAYRQSIEELSRLTHTSEPDTAARALSIAKRTETRIGDFLRGPGRQMLLDNLISEPPAKVASPFPPGRPQRRESFFRIDPSHPPPHKDHQQS